MKHVSTIFLVLFGCVALAYPASAESLKFAIINFEPQMSVKDGVPVGGWIDEMNRVAKEVGVDISYEEVPAKRMTEGLGSGVYDGSIAAPSLAGIDKGFVVASTMVFQRAVLQVYAVGQDPGVTKIEQLAGKELIVNRGYMYGGRRAWIDDPANQVKVVLEAKDAPQALTALTKGRAPYLLQYRDNIRDARNSVPGAGNLKASTLSDVGINVVISTKRADAKELVAKIDAAIAKLRKSGEISDPDAAGTS